MRKIGIIGLGHVGATVAYTLFTHGIADELVLIDKNDDKVTAEYNDLRDALAVNNYYVQIK
ncbi:MAG TPA: L-lactate dehydrogenase, partial [Lactobacillus acetotolerans]|nr:L-lactate dehydrogenase [Lactobacillus acetotolerans]